MTATRERRDPLARKKLRHVPSGLRSRAMHALSARVAQGRFALQACTECGTATYPPRDACPLCWGELAWTEQPSGAKVLCETTIRVSTDLYFREHMPWRMGKVLLDVGPVALVHLHAALHPDDRADVRMMIDRAGNAALFAVPAGDTDLMSDPQWREFIVPIEGRIALVSDARNAIGRAIVKELQARGAELVVAGLPGPALASDADDPVLALERVQTIALDVTDATSVAEAASRIGGPLDIVVNTSRHVRSGGVSANPGFVEQRRAFEVSAMGLSRLASTFAPMLAGRPHGAFVDVLSSAALGGDASQAGFAAAEAARHSLLQSLRHEMRGAGVRVMAVFTGPVEDSDHQALPPPKVAPSRIAASVAEALLNGREQTCVGDVAQDAMERWLADPALLAREKNL